MIGSDHGEAFGEHGREGHARDLYTEVVEVPLIIVPPFRLEPGIVVNERVANVDIFPTLLDLLGMDPIPGAQGVSLVPLIEAAGRGQGAPPEAWKSGGDQPRFSELDQHWARPEEAPQPLVTVTRGPWRFMAQTSETGKTREQLFDHREDPGEQRSVLGVDPAQDALLRADIEGYRALPPAPWGAPAEIHLDEMRMNQLKALGYVVEEVKGKADEKEAAPPP